MPEEQIGSIASRVGDHIEEQGNVNQYDHQSDQEVFIVVLAETIMHEHTIDDQLIDDEEKGPPIQDDGFLEHRRQQDADKIQRIQHIEEGRVIILLQIAAFYDDGQGQQELHPDSKPGVSPETGPVKLFQLEIRKGIPFFIAQQVGQPGERHFHPLDDRIDINTDEDGGREQDQLERFSLEPVVLAPEQWIKRKTDRIWNIEARTQQMANSGKRFCSMNRMEFRKMRAAI